MDKHISNELATQQHQGIQRAQEHIKYLKTLESRTDIINKPTLKVLQAKYASERICEIDLLQLDKQVKISLLRIHVITGWIIPVAEITDLLVDELRSKLLEDYSDLNFDEIIFAFRNYSKRFKDWGKELNMELITNVLDAYGEDRYDAGLLEERIKMESNKRLEFKPKEYTEDEILSIALDYWQNSKAPKIEFLNPHCYEILVKQGKINLTDETKERIRKTAKIMMTDYFRNAIELKTMLADENYKSMLCKKISVSEYFNSLKDENK